MRMYLSAESKNKIGYIPDWLQVSYTNENGVDCTLCLDIQAYTEYDNTTLNCRCKGDLIPWTLIEGDEDEINLYELDDYEFNSMFPDKKVVDILCKGHNFRVGVHIANEEDSEEAEDDVFKEGDGELYIDSNEIKFNFEVENY